MMVLAVEAVLPFQRAALRGVVHELHFRYKGFGVAAGMAPGRRAGLQDLGGPAGKTWPAGLGRAGLTRHILQTIQYTF